MRSYSNPEAVLPDTDGTSVDSDADVRLADPGRFAGMTTESRRVPDGR